MYRDFLSEDPCDGLEVNLLIDARFMSRYNTSVSMFDADNICIEVKDEVTGGRSFHKVSIMGKVRLANAYKSLKLNGYKERIKGR